jgi:hypothetical protein
MAFCIYIPAKGLVIMAQNRIEVTAEIRAHYGAVVPTLIIKFQIENQLDSEISILALNYDLYLSTGTGEKLLLGTGSLYTRRGNNGELSYCAIKPGNTDWSESYFELGYSKVAEIERVRNKKPDGLPSIPINKIPFQIDLYGKFVKLIQKDDRGNESIISHLNFGNEIHFIVEPSDWVAWLNHWGEKRQMIEVSSELKLNLDEFKEVWHKLDYSDVIYKLMDSAGAFSGTLQQPSREFLRSMVGEGELRPRIIEMISRAEKEILISGWMDTSLLCELKKKGSGVAINVLSPGTDDRGKKAVITAYRELHEIAHLKTNPLLHSRMIIIDGIEALLTSADLNAASLTQNFEMGIWTTEPYFVHEAHSYFMKMWEHKDSSNIENK